MNNPEWDEDFAHQLQVLLSVATSANIRFPWANFRIQGYSPREAIAYLIQTHRLYPELELLPMPPPKYGMGQIVVRRANGKRDCIVAARWWQSLEFHWSYRVGDSFGRGSRSNVWFAEAILDPMPEASQENFAEVL